ncbi:zinc ribbon domain-containing protein [Patescibacteria group bacterium]|nr:zinc ribbon domain-containing protein [Patescibacteria group bacterium]
MNKDKKGGGSNVDGSISEKYCSMCYENGKFLTPPEVNNAKKMQEFCIQEMKKDEMNGIFAWIATRGIPRLERWKQ